ncbi:DNA repair photolyase [Archaeoglobus sulfaticallidus PM70-1]|uniref:DNA repair photolyase n=1 Tax=Archaeoglobus sulfaticallidus PM70-1 TaxID=387631 RepID=N0BHU7_9EURY|nr:radical SAM protein [Archaeoglobus sulfaticallidus]AGK61882.1 DNA repair photolyase [Archaeoglobus sulfaticallidus PM70-1]
MKIVKIKAKKAFAPTKIPGAKWVVNQYIGCQHACKYCYAKFMCRWYNHGKWGSWVVVKENMADLVKKQVVNGSVYMSSVSDPYQPIEKEFRLTRNVLKNMDKRIKLSILTKSDLVLRDIDLFKKFNDIEVGLTINSFEGAIKKKVEPFSSSNKRRIEAFKELRENGVRNYAFISPIIPHLTDIEHLIEETKSFTNFYWFEFLNLKASGKEFREWLKQNYPESYEILSDKTKAEKYVKEVINAIKKAEIFVKGICVHYPKLMVVK